MPGFDPHPAFGDVHDHHGEMDVGDRMLIPCDGGPCTSRLVLFPPPLEIEERDGVYVLVDDGSPESWRYDFVTAAR